jgi:hypothetical protein
MKWILTKDERPPSGKNLVVGWYKTPNSVRSFEGATINADPMEFWGTRPPDFWAHLEDLELPTPPPDSGIIRRRKK